MIRYNEWNATHTGWILLAPVFLADIDDTIVPIPRWKLWWWYEVNLWVNDNIVNNIISLVNENAIGYMFWGVRKLKQPRIIKVKLSK